MPDECCNLRRDIQPRWRFQAEELLFLRPVKHLRWWIVWVLFASTVINYISRQTLSVLAPVIIKEYHFSHADYSHIVSAFQISYAIMFLLGGILVDIIGPRLALSLAIVWWSLASMLTSFANSILSFSVSRFLLGMGEGCNWPGQAGWQPNGFLPGSAGLRLAFTTAVPASEPLWRRRW